LAARANEPEAFITALDTVGRLFGDAARLTPDRAFHLARSVSTGSDLSMSSCRTCSTHYLTCHTTPKIELAASFYCPSCTGALTAPRKGKPRKQLA
ncbi:FlhC family transcriptional regulator, partial [Staphylococcus aureus]|uniref:FlhC family transcriptional regulator n=1 Tax=Staphylococcus aureus TaxID=1280 RepID=UPI000D4A6FD1